MVWLIKIFYGLSNAVLVTITVAMLIGQFLFSAFQASEIEMASKRYGKLEAMTFSQLGQIRVEG